MIAFRAAGRGISRGVILSFYVADAAEEAGRLAAAGIPIVQPLRDEIFGQRHVIVADPDGVLIDSITPISPAVADSHNNFTRRAGDSGCASLVCRTYVWEDQL